MKKAASLLFLSALLSACVLNKQESQLVPPEEHPIVPVTETVPAAEITPAVAVEPAAEAEPAYLKFIPEIAAEVAGEPITRKMMVDYIKKNVEARMMNEDLLVSEDIINRAVLAPIIDDMLTRRLLTFEGYPPSYEASVIFLEKMIAKMPPEELNGFQAMLAERGLTRDEFIKQEVNNVAKQRNMAFQRWLDEKIIPSIGVPDSAQLKAYYDEKTQAEMFLFRILVAVPRDASEEDVAAAQAKIDKIEAELKNGGSFTKLAEEYSDCVSGKLRGGCVNVVPLNETIPFPAIQQALENLKPGMNSTIVRSPEGFEIYRSGTFEDSVPMLNFLWKFDEQQRLINQKFTEIQQKSNVKIYLKNE